MSTLVEGAAGTRTGTSPRTGTASVLRHLAVAEARHLWRHPLLYVGLVLSAVTLWVTVGGEEGWSGARYTGAPIVSAPFCLAVSLIVAGSFHRERTTLGQDAPVPEEVRAAGRVLGAATVLPLVAALVVTGALWLRAVGGFTLGEEPGRTLHAEYSATELLQHVALVVLAIGLGAAAGRRLRHLGTAALVLFLTWLPVSMVSWAFQHPRVAPFSVIQTQPVNVRVGPVDTDPLQLPSSWLLSAPNEYQDHWGRQFVSVGLGGWHDAWLVGLALLLLGVAVPGRWRPVLLSAGGALAVVSVVAQQLVIP